MNKKLLALAVGTAFALPMVAAAEGPKVYGLVDLSLENQDNGADAWFLESNSSRAGVKGSLELNDGLEGIYQVEARLAADDGTAGLGGDLRDTYAGVKGEFGTLKLGTLDTPLKKAQGKVDVFNDDNDIDMTSHVAGENRADNSIWYSSPSFSGLTVNVAVMPGEAPGVADGIAESASASLVYDNEGLYAALAMDSEVVGDGGLSVPAGAAVDAMRLVGAYSSDEFMVGLMFQTAEDANGVAEDESIVLSGSYTMDAITLKASFQTTEGDDGTPAVDPEATLMGIGVDYALGKTSTVYAQVANIEVDTGAATAEYDEFGVGLRHKF